MPKIPKTRIVLRDQNGGFWRLCNISNLVDSRQEPYLKIMLPEFKSGLFTNGIGFREQDGFSKELNGSKSIKCSPESISYHYMGGLRHLKTREGAYLSTNRNFPNIEKAKKSILICRFVIANFDSYEKLPNSIEGDIVLKDIACPIIIGLYINHRTTSDKILHVIERSDGKTTYFESNDSKIFLSVTEYNVESVDFSGIFLNKAAYDYEDSTDFWPWLIYKTKKIINKIFPKILKGY